MGLEYYKQIVKSMGLISYLITWRSWLRKLGYWGKDSEIAYKKIIEILKKEGKK